MKKQPEAEADFRLAVSLAPDDVDVIYNLANFQYDQGDTKAVLKAISAIPAEKRDGRCIILAWNAAIDTEDKEIMRKAWEDNKDVKHDVSGMVLLQRMTFFSLGSIIQANCGDFDNALLFLEIPSDDLMPHFYRNLLKAQVYVVLDDIHNAVPFLLAAVEKIDDSVPNTMAITLARYLCRAELHKHAWEILKDRVPRTRVGNDTALLLNSAAAAKQDDFALEFCKDLRKNNVYDAQAINYEIDECVKYHSLNKAVSIALECLDQPTLSNVAKRHLRLRLSSFGISLRRPDLIERDPSKLPQWDELKPEHCEAMVAALLETNTPIAAIEFAYEMFRRHPNDYHTWRAVVAAMLFPCNTRPAPRTPDIVAEDTAVRYRKEDTNTEHWFIIASETNPQLALDEISTEHSFAKVMSGKQVNDVVELPEPAGKATILEIVDKHVYRCQFCAEKMADRFPEKTMVWVIRGNPDEQHGETFVKRLLAKTKILNEGKEEILNVYRCNEIPLSWLASKFRQTTFEMAIEASSESMRLPIRIAFGNMEEATRADKWLNESSQVVIDTTACASIIQLGMGDVLSDPKWSFSTTEDVHTQVTTYADPYLPTRTHGMQREIQEFLAVLNKCVKVEDGISLARMQPRPSEDDIQIYGDSALLAIALAKEHNAILWIDDRAIAYMANSTWGIKAVNTRTFLEYLHSSGKYSSEKYHEILLQMLALRYSHVVLDQEVFRYATNVTLGDLTDPRLENILAVLADDNVSPQNVVRLAQQVIKYAWQQQLFSPRPENITIRILENVFSRHDGRPLVINVIRGIRNIFSFDLNNAAVVEDVCIIWSHSKFL